MANADGGRTWIPYKTTRDCSQGYCGIYCPQLCYTPPPPALDFSDDSSSGATFSPLVIAIIGILASALLLVGYYFIVTKNCGGFDYLSRRREMGRGSINYLGDGDHHHDGGGDARRLHRNEAWHVAMSDGLEDSVIKSIAVCKYKKSDGFVDGTECSVCLAEFNEDETLRLLPRCSHAFHIHCIDTWLKSHSNCPLCRSIVVSPITPATYFPPQSQPQPQPQPQPPPPTTAVNPPTPQVSNETPISIQDLGRGGGGDRNRVVIPKDPPPTSRVAIMSEEDGHRVSIPDVDEVGPPMRKSSSGEGVGSSVSRSETSNNGKIPMKTCLSGRSLRISKHGNNGSSLAVLPVRRHYSDSDSDSDL